MSATTAKGKLLTILAIIILVVLGIGLSIHKFRNVTEAAACPASLQSPITSLVVLDANDNALYFSRAPIPFPRDGKACATSAYAEGVWGLGHMGVYAYRREFLLSYSSLPASSLQTRESLEQLRAIEAGLDIHVGVVEPPKGRPVDTESDYRAFVERNKNQAGS